VYKALLGQQLSVEEFTDLDDVSVLHCLKLWTRADDAPLADLCRGLLFRQVFKTIDLSHLSDARQLRSIVAAAEAAVAAAGGDPAYDLFYDEPSDTPYETYQPDGCGAAGEILVRGPDGTLTPFGSISPLTRALNQQLMFRRLHVAGPWKAVAEEAVRPLA
jgi:hypothetical protein